MQGESLRPGEYATFTAMATIGFDDNDASATYRAVANLEGDENTLDNTSADVTVQRVYSEKTAPTDLTVEKDGEGVILTWEAPELPEVPAEVIEDCEDLPSWSYENIGDWTLVDADQGEIGGATNVAFPKNPVRSKRSFFVFDKNDGGFNESWNVHSGSKCLMAMFNYDDTLSTTGPFHSNLTATNRLSRSGHAVIIRIMPKVSRCSARIAGANCPVSRW